MTGLILDPFGGMGGWAEGLRTLGLVDVGIDTDEMACRTRRAAGHPAIRADVATFPLAHLRGKVDGLCMSPPCPDFSAAGRRRGVKGDSGHLIFQVPRWVHGVRPRWVACEQVPAVLPYWKLFAAEFRETGYSCWAGILCAADFGVPQERYRAILMCHRDRPVHPPAPTHAEHPEEGFDGVRLPWVSMAEGLGWGMTQRPFVTVCHGTGGGPDPAAVGGSGARRTIGRERSRVVGYRRTRGSGMSERHGQRPETPADRPAPTITSKARSDVVLTVAGTAVQHPTERGVDRPAPPVGVVPEAERWRWTVNTRQRSKLAQGRLEDYRREVDRPSPTMTTNGRLWQWERPATTVCADPRIPAPGYRDHQTRSLTPCIPAEQAAKGEPSGTEAIRLTIEEALILQGFDPAYPVQGSRTKRFEQVGNAIPPPLAAAIVAVLDAP